MVGDIKRMKKYGLIQLSNPHTGKVYGHFIINMYERMSWMKANGKPQDLLLRRIFSFDHYET